MKILGFRQTSFLKKGKEKKSMIREKRLDFLEMTKIV